ncbi:MAG: hypothetical protein JNM45_05815 [Rhizobiales bacterium]|nr:hypothetical protein [Hyphomicrobiales bacterium]
MKSALVLINRNSGTVRTRGAEPVVALVREALAPVFSPLDVDLFEGDIAPRLKAALGRYDVIIAGGGDGTIATAAAELLDSDTILGALPLGTMNLFVQALGFSPRLEDALAQLASAEIQAIDVGTANDRIFLHQVSFGLQPRMGKLREKLGYKSRAGKLFSTTRALFILAMRPRMVRGRVRLDGDDVKVSAPMLAVTNNPIGSDRHWSVQHRLDSGVLGYYALSEFSLRTLVRLARDYIRNRMHDAELIEHRTATKITLNRQYRRLRLKRRKGILASLDGEIIVLDNPVTIGMKPKSLKVLALPAAAQDGN